MTPTAPPTELLDGDFVELAKIYGMRYVNRHCPDQSSYGFTSAGLMEFARAAILADRERQKPDVDSSRRAGESATDCGEAGCAEGRCGNAGCMPSRGWFPIKSADPQATVLLWAPWWKLSEDPKHPDEYRVAKRRDWTWATHWMRLPAAPRKDFPDRKPTDKPAVGIGSSGEPVATFLDDGAIGGVEWLVRQGPPLKHGDKLYTQSAPVERQGEIPGLKEALESMPEFQSLVAELRADIAATPAVEEPTA